MIKRQVRVREQRNLDYHRFCIKLETPSRDNFFKPLWAVGEYVTTAQLWRIPNIEAIKPGSYFHTKNPYKLPLFNSRRQALAYARYIFGVLEPRRIERARGQGLYCGFYFYGDEREQERLTDDPETPETVSGPRPVVVSVGAEQ